MTPEELRKEASAAEFLAGLVSYAPDKERLRARAEELRSWADAMEATPAAGPVRDDAAAPARSTRLS